MEQITEILEAVGRGEKKATEDLLPLLYGELRKLAANRLAKEPPGQTLQATALVHEAYLRLVGTENPGTWDSRGHFFAAAAEAMRRILVDRARAKQTLKRGGERERLELQEADLAVSIPAEELVAVNDALDCLAAEAPLAAEVVKMRCFAGLQMDEIATALHMSRSAVTKHWAYARAWILEHLGEGEWSM